MQNENSLFVSQTIAKGASFSSIIAVFLTIFVSDDTLLFGHTDSISMIVAKIIVNLGLFFFFLRDARPHQALIFGAIFLLMFVLSMTANADFGINYGYVIFMMALAYVFTGKITLHLYAYWFVRILFILSIVSVFYWLVMRINGGALSGLPTVTNNLGYPASTIFICSSYGASAMRAMSIFREPGVYAMYLAMALVFELLFLEKKSIWRQVVFVVSMFLTFSSSGILMLVPIGIAWLTMRGRSGRSFLWAGLMVIVCLLVVFFNEEVMHRAISRNLSEDMLEANPRIVSQIVPFCIWLENPIGGVGISGFLPEWELKTGEMYGVMLGEGISTSTFANGLAKYGILWAVILIPLYSLSRQLSIGNSVGKWCIYATIIGMLLAQNFPYCVFLWVLIFYGCRAFYTRERFMGNARSVPVGRGIMR